MDDHGHAWDTNKDVHPPTWRGMPLIRPLIIRSTEPVSDEEFREVCEFIAGTPYPVIVLNRKWEVV